MCSMTVPGWTSATGLLKGRAQNVSTDSCSWPQQNVTYTISISLAWHSHSHVAGSSQIHTISLFHSWSCCSAFKDYRNPSLLLSSWLSWRSDRPVDLNPILICPSQTFWSAMIEWFIVKICCTCISEQTIRRLIHLHSFLTGKGHSFGAYKTSLGLPKV